MPKFQNGDFEILILAGCGKTPMHRHSREGGSLEGFESRFGRDWILASAGMTLQNGKRLFQHLVKFQAATIQHPASAGVADLGKGGLNPGAWRYTFIKTRQSNLGEGKD